MTHKLLPILSQPTEWRFGELTSLKVAMVCLGIIVALGTPASFWAENYWLVWLVFVIAMIVPASKTFGPLVNGHVKPVKRPARKLA